MPFLLLSDLTLSASICAHLAPCLPRVRILLVESVLPGFPPPADGSGRTVHARCVQLALRASVPVRRRLRSCCCFESFQHLPIRLPLRAGLVESVASNDRPCGIVFGSRPAAVLRASNAPSDPVIRLPLEGTSVSAEMASAPGAAASRASSGFRSGDPASSGVLHRGNGFGSWCCCFESFERSVRSGFLRKGRPSSQIRHRFLVLLLLL